MAQNIGKIRRAFLPLAGVAVALAVLAFWRATGPEEPTAPAARFAHTMVVYKNATCGCCNDWIEHVREAGFAVTAHNVSPQELNRRKRQAGLDYGMGSCHTAFVGGYPIEGHVPAADIKRLLHDRPDVAGLAVPGMPIGSPGMEMGDRRDAYEVLSFDHHGNSEIFVSYPR